MSTKNQISSDDFYNNLNKKKSKKSSRKSELAWCIRNIIKCRRLKLKQAAALIKLRPSQLSKLTHGKLKKFSISTLESFVQILSK